MVADGRKAEKRVSPPGQFDFSQTMSSTKMGGATAALFRQAATSLQPCTCSAAARQFSSTAKRTATVLKAEKLDKGNDPLDMTFLQEFGYDDLPASSHRIIEHDREKLHLLRLIQFQLPEIRSSASPMYVDGSLVLRVMLGQRCDVHTTHPPPLRSSNCRQSTILQTQITQLARKQSLQYLRMQYRQRQGT